MRMLSESVSGIPPLYHRFHLESKSRPSSLMRHHRLLRLSAISSFRPSSSLFKENMMGGDRTPNWPPSYGRGSVSAGKSSMCRDDRSSKSSIVDYRAKSPQPIRPQLGQTSLEGEMARCNVGSPERIMKMCPFDICKTESGGPVKLNRPIFDINREKRKEKEVSLNKHLKSGMVLLKKFISHHDQVRIIKSCRELGMGLGGFYRPSYGDGAKLHLQMMCLGMNWDPETRKYEDERPTDGATPPRIPEDFKNLVDKAIQASYDFLRQNSGGINVEDEIPRMSPDICIVNFYSENGKLGLHQDKDESENSLSEGLPVVSFSLGDSAEFLYGEERDVDKAEKVVLESGDVLIFGGKSRHLFHGVSSISQNTAPKHLIDDSKLRPGRLNLTFRQY